ncbi:LmeA family phospholipid-binding protein [Actinoplanes palleronii]|uniref:LmeA family phospholipid-binding protein n=1 Tax=Actinoplanes palleronii TaxID=113570 RepID=UPI0019422126|nr:DUF2993 domain-containing protein [Actinoplanes palleronii]
MRKSLIITGAVLGGLVAAGSAGDRYAATSAADRLAERLRCAAGLTEPPEVTLGGIPFLTQLARGRFDEVRVTAASVTVGRFSGGLRATARQVRTAGDAFRAASLTVTATMSYAGTAASTGVAGLSGLGYDGAGRLRMAVTTQVLGRDVPVVVHAVPEIAGDALVVRPVEVEIPVIGVRLPAAQLGEKAAPRTIPLPELPGGLHYRGAEAAEDGLQITVDGTDVAVPRDTGTGATAGGRAGRDCGENQR